MNGILALTSKFVSREETLPFRRSRAGWAVAALNLLMGALSTNFFLVMLKAGVDGWLMMNSCAPSIALFVVGFLLGSPLVMVAGAVLMFRYGTLGLFVFSWTGGNLIGQVSHICMTLAVIYVLVDVVRGQRWKTLAWGVVLGLAILLPYMAVQDSWLKAHPELAEKLFNGTLVPTTP